LDFGIEMMLLHRLSVSMVYPAQQTMTMIEPTSLDRQPKANKARLDNRWGCSIGHVLP